LSRDYHIRRGAVTVPPKSWEADHKTLNRLGKPAAKRQDRCRHDLGASDRQECRAYRGRRHNTTSERLVRNPSFS
jgi:hypothetical protein